jgi:anti-sigma B factor antagonist
MNTLATVEIRRHGDISLAQVQGEIDTSNIREIADVLEAEGPRAGAGLVVDLSSVTYLNSATVKLLFELAGALRERRQQLRLVMTETAPMRGLLLMLGFDHVVPVHTRLEDALAEMHAGATDGGDGEDADAH